MAFNFLGSIEDLDDLEEFEEFINIEILKVGERRKHLEQEKKRLNILLGKFKLADLKMRSPYKKSQPADADWLDNARPSEKTFIKKNDALTALDVDLLKKGLLDTIKYKREKNEFKIKRILDLIEQITDESAMLEERQNDYQDIMKRIRGRFEFPDFNELEKTSPVDSADVIPGIRATPKDAGLKIVETLNPVTATIEKKVYYQVICMDSKSKIITFANSAPPLFPGDKIIFSNGKNNGEKTFWGNAGTLGILIDEDFVDEIPSQSLVYIPT